MMMNSDRKNTRTAAERARTTASIVGSLMHEGYVVTPEAEAIHAKVERGELTTEEAIAIFRERALASEAKRRERGPGG